MDKRTFHFFLITILFFIGYYYFLAKFYPQKPLSSSPQHNLKEVSNTQLLDNKIVIKKTPPKEILEGNLKEVKIGNFIVTISLIGGYIKEIYIIPYKEKVSFTNLGVTPEFATLKFSLSQPQKNTLVLENQEANIKKVWEFSGYSITNKIILPKKGTPIYLFYNLLSSNGFEQRYQEIFYKDTPHLPLKRKNIGKIKVLKNPYVVIAGARDRYFCYILYNGPYENIDFIRKDKKTVVAITSNKENLSVWHFYLGPQIGEELALYKLQEIINYGIFNGIGVVILKILHFFNQLFHNWGISIILLTLLIYLILFPFTMKSTQAMKKMQEIQPYIQELQRKYKDNPQKLHKEQIELFKKYKVNPFGSCLPLFFQFPVFIALYQVLFRSVELKGAQFLWIKDLSLPDHTFKLPFSLPWLGNYINILPLLLIIIYFFQQKMTSTSLDSQQQSMGLFFVLFMGLIFYNFPSALVLYWLLQSFLTFIYQFRIKKLTLNKA